MCVYVYIVRYCYITSMNNCNNVYVYIVKYCYIIIIIMNNCNNAICVYIYIYRKILFYDFYDSL